MVLVIKLRKTLITGNAKNRAKNYTQRRKAVTAKDIES